VIVVKSDKEFRESLHAATWSEIYGEWRFLDISELNIKIELDFFLPFIEEEKLVQFSEIAWKGMNFPLDMRRDNCVCCDGKRYKECDISFPGILLENAPNQYGLRYRMVDGKHRLDKLISMGKKESFFRIVKYERVKPELIQVLKQMGEDK